SITHLLSVEADGRSRENLAGAESRLALDPGRRRAFVLGREARLSHRGLRRRADHHLQTVLAPCRTAVSQSGDLFGRRCLLHRQTGARPDVSVRLRFRLRLRLRLPDLSLNLNLNLFDLARRFDVAKRLTGTPRSNSQAVPYIKTVPPGPKARAWLRRDEQA